MEEFTKELKRLNSWKLYGRSKAHFHVKMVTAWAKSGAAPIIHEYLLSICPLYIPASIHPVQNKAGR